MTGGKSFKVIGCITRRTKRMARINANERPNRSNAKPSAKTTRRGVRRAVDGDVIEADRRARLAARSVMGLPETAPGPADA